MEQVLHGKKAIVTGASRGIGKAIAAMLVHHGAHTLAVGRDVHALQTLQQALGENLVPHVADLSDPRQVEGIVEKAASLWNHIDVLIHNAAVAEQAPLRDTTLEQWDAHMMINARAPFILSKAALPLLQPEGTIIAISSVVGQIPYANQGAYSASKHALEGLMKVLALEVQPLGIRVHIIAPGGVATEMIHRMRPDIPPEALTQPHEIADVIAFLLTHRNHAMMDRISIRRPDKRPF